MDTKIVDLSEFSKKKEILAVKKTKHPKQVQMIEERRSVTRDELKKVIEAYEINKKTKKLKKAKLVLMTD